MQQVYIVLATIVGALTMFGALFSLYLAPLKQELAAMTKKLDEIEGQLDKFDERQRRHTADTDRHITIEWRTDMQTRTRNLESLVLKIAAKLGVDA